MMSNLIAPLYICLDDRNNHFTVTFCKKHLLKYSSSKVLAPQTFMVKVNFHQIIDIYANVIQIFIAKMRESLLFLFLIAMTPSM